MTTPGHVRANAVLLHTDVFSYLFKGTGDNAERYRRHVRNKTAAITFITIGEVYSGLFRKGVGQAQFDALEAHLRALVVIPYNLDICKAYGRLGLEKTDTGSDRVVAVNDRWIAACAIHHQLSLVTNNRRHFEGISGLNIITEAPSPQTLNLGRDSSLTAQQHGVSPLPSVFRQRRTVRRPRLRVRRLEDFRVEPSGPASCRRRSSSSRTSRVT